MHPLYHSYLTKKEREHPRHALKRLCSRNDLSDLRQQLWHWLRESLAANNSIYETAEARDELLHTYEELNRFLDAVYLMYSFNKEKDEPRTKLQRTYDESSLWRVGSSLP